MAQDREISISLTAPQGPLTVSADSLRMEQVFTNLLANALKFTPRGGRIDVAAEERGADILVTVADSGVGIPAEHLDRVFDRFYRVPMPAGSAVEGTGLGLSICKAVVEEHGGRIWVESQVGRGSTFFVTIPKGRTIEDGHRLRSRPRGAAGPRSAEAPRGGAAHHRLRWMRAGSKRFAGGTRSAGKPTGTSASGITWVGRSRSF